MNEPKIKVPKELDYAVESAIGYHRRDLAECDIPEIARISSFAFAKALAENPIVPTDGDVVDMAKVVPDDEDYITKPKNYCVEWQRRMFLAPEPEGPEAIRD